MHNNYEFELVDIFSQYISSRDKTNLTPSAAVKNSKNMYKKRSGNFANRPGRKAYSPIDSTLAGVKSAYVWQTALGLSFPLQVANGKLRILSSISGAQVWYDLMTDAATLNRYVFAPYYTATEAKDTLIMARGDSNLYTWSGGMGLIASASDAAGLVTGVAVTAGGSGYAVNDHIRVLSGNQDLILRVDLLSGSAVSALTIIAIGTGYTLLTGMATSTLTGAGTGCTIEVTSVNNYSVTIAGTKTAGQLGFDTNGSFTVNGNNYSYTAGTLSALDGNTIYGLSGSASLEALNSVIIQTVETTASTPSADFTNDFIAVLQSQLFVGSYTSNKIWISADGTVAGADFSDFTNTGSLVSGDPDFAILDSSPTGMIPRSGKMYISGGISDWYVITPNSPLPVAVSIGGGSSAFVQTLVEKLPGTGLSGALAHEFITIVGNNIVYIGQDHQLRTIGSFRNIFDIKFPVLSQLVYDDLLDEDFTGGHIFSNGDFIYITAPINSRHWMFETRESVSEEGNITAERIWHPPQITGISRFIVVLGVLYGHSNTNPMIYQVWDTEQWYDDSPNSDTFDQLPYECVLAMAYRHFPNKGGKSYRRQGKIIFDKIYVEGYMAPGTPLYGKIYYDYQGSTDIQNIFINSPAVGGVPSQSLPVKNVKLFTYTDAPSLPQDMLADNPVGTGLAISKSAQDYLPKFRAIRTVKLKDCFEFGIELYSYEIGARWELLAVGPNMQLAERVAENLL